MKRVIAAILSLSLLFNISACSSVGENQEMENKNASSAEGLEREAVNSEAESESKDEESGQGKTLVAYFSATGNTRAVAEELANMTGADLYAIEPAQPYTDEDLDYNDDNSRASQEQNDDSARPEIGSEDLDMSSYDTILLGYPIWWGSLPKIIYSFMDKYDLSGKVVLPFCTSGGSGIDESVGVIRQEESSADVSDGLRAEGPEDKRIEEWLAENNIEFSR